jgi:hypothetical protein
MTSSFFRVLADPKKSRWFLDEPLSATGQVIDARQFTQGSRYEGPTPMSVPIAQPGPVVNFNLAAFDMPVTSEHIAGILRQFSHDFQCFPIAVDKNKTSFQIVNATARVKCLDESRSEIVKWKPEDGRPERVGCYRMVTNLWIEPRACRNQHVFRVEGWEIALIVSDEVKEAIESTPDLGVVFGPVCL